MRYVLIVWVATSGVRGADMPPPTVFDTHKECIEVGDLWKASVPNGKADYSCLPYRPRPAGSILFRPLK